MQALLDLMSIIGNPTQGSVKALAGAAQTEEDAAAAVDGFISLLEQRLGELAAENPEGATLSLEDFELDPEALAENTAGLDEAGVTDLLRSLSARQAISEEPIVIGPQTPPSPVPFNNLLEAIGQDPIDLSDLDADILNIVDPQQLTADLERLKQLFTAVTTEDGEALSEEELLAILESELSPPPEAAIAGAALAADADPEEADAEEGIEVTEAQAITAPITQSISQEGDEVDVELTFQRNQRAEDRLLDRLEARDARVAATEEGGDELEDGLEAAVLPTATNTNGAGNGTSNGPINLTNGVQLASLGNPGSDTQEHGAQGGQTGNNGNGFNGLFGDDAGQTNPSLATQANNTNTNFQAVMASNNAARAPMNPAAMQVNVSLRNAVAQGQTQLQIQLKPASLGMVDVKLAFESDGAVRGTLIVDRPETLEMLRNDSRTLEKALQDAGLNLESGGLEYSLRDGGDAQNNEQDKAGNNGRGASDELDAIDGEDAPILEQTMDIITEDQVDVRV